jgi:hypothetical protein
MSSSVEKAALKLLGTFGMRAIWDLHLAATAAYDMGNPELVANLTELAEAAERCWMQRQTIEMPVLKRERPSRLSS